MSERGSKQVSTNWSDFLEINNLNEIKTFHVEVWPISCLNDSEIQDRGLKELNSKTFPRGNMLRTPLEACAFDSRFRKSVSFYPRSAPDVHSLRASSP